MPQEDPLYESEDEVTIIRIGVAAVESVMQTFERWLDIARALEVGRRIAMRVGHTNRPEGANYNGAFSQWLALHPQLQRIKPATRTWLYKCLEHELEILEWRRRQGDAEHSRYHYPETVFKRWY